MAEFANKEIDQIEKLLEIIKDLKKELKDVSKAAADMVKNIEVDKARSKQIQDLTKAQQTLVATTKELTKIEKQEAGLIARINTLRNGEQDEIIKLKVQQAELLKQKKQEAKENEGLVSAYQKQSKRLRELKNEYKDLVIQGKKADKGTENLRKEIIKLDKELRDLDKSVGDSFREIGKYENAVEQLEKDLKDLAITAGGAALSMEALEGAIESNQEASESYRKIKAGVGAAITDVGNRAADTALDMWDFGKSLFSGEESALALAKNVGITYLQLDKLGVELDKTAGQTDHFVRMQKNAETTVMDNVNASIEAEEKLIALEKVARGYAKQVENLNGQIERQNQIAGDSTKSFDQIAAAAEKALKLERTRNAILVKQAKEELSILQSRRIEGQNNLELDNKIAEKQVELIGLNNELRLSTLELNRTLRENARDRFERELDFAIDAFDVQKTLNERRFAQAQDNLELQKEILLETTAASKKAFDNQIKLVQDFVGEEIDIKSLVEEKDEEVVRKRLEGYDIDDNTLGRLLEMYREQIMLKGDLLDMENDLNDAIRERADNEIEAWKEITQFRLDRAAETAEGIDEIEEAQIKATSNRFDVQIRDLEEGSAQRILLEKQKEAEITDIQKKAEEERQREKDKAAAEDAARLAEQREEAFKFAQDLTSELGSELTKRSQARIEGLDKELEAAQNSLDRQLELGEQGSEAQIAFENERINEINKQRKEALKKQQQQEEAVKLAGAFISSFEARVSQDPNTALQKATQDVFLARGIAKALAEGFAYDGTEDTGGGAGLDEKNGMLWMVHPNERIMSKAQNQLVGDLSNDELASLAYNYRMGTPMNQGIVDNSEVVKQLEMLNNRPIQQIDIDKLGNIIEVLDNGRMKTRTRLKTRGRL